jgi:hypothetical protein
MPLARRGRSWVGQPDTHPSAQVAVRAAATRHGGAGEV